MFAILQNIYNAQVNGKAKQKMKYGLNQVNKQKHAQL